MKRCVIFCAGQVTSADVAAAAITEDDLIIGADRGYQRAMEHGVTPHLVLGDFDSVRRPDLPGTLVYPAEKDDTDSMLAIRRALEQGCGEIVLLGALGGRLDHTMANLQSLVFILDHGARGWLIGEGSTATVVRDSSLTLERRECYLSVFAMGGVCTGVTLEGVFYPLADYTMTPSFPIGVSNRFVAEQAVITVEHGTLLVMLVEFD